MARLALRFTVLLLLFAFSQARFIHEHDANPEETIMDLPESDPHTASAILLPSERPGFEPAKLVDFKHDDDASETDSHVDSTPLTAISFRPINRHFPRRPMIPFRHKHNCRFHKRFRQLNPRFQQKRYTIPYGDDMIMADERPRFHPEKPGFVRQIQARWARFPDDVTGFNEAVDFIVKPHPHDHEHDHDEEHHHHEHEHELKHDHHEERHHHEHEHELKHDHHEEHHHHEHGIDHDEHLHHRHEEVDDNEREEHEHPVGLKESFRKFLGLF